MTESCRLITTEQYQEYLKLKEEHKPISWEELKEEAKKMGWIHYDGDIDCIYYRGLQFNKDGTLRIWDGLFYHKWAEHRTPDQMLAIMKALQ